MSLLAVEGYLLGVQKDYTCLVCTPSYHTPFNRGRARPHLAWGRAEGLDRFTRCLTCGAIFEFHPDLTWTGDPNQYWERKDHDA